eukprot:6209808-Prymnesium_polylepis.1
MNHDCRPRVLDQRDRAHFRAQHPLGEHVAVHPPWEAGPTQHERVMRRYQERTSRQPPSESLARPTRSPAPPAATSAGAPARAPPSHED